MPSYYTERLAAERLRACYDLVPPRTKAYLEAETSADHPKFLPILSLLEALDEQFRRGKTISAGKYLHLFMLGVDGRFAGHGIGAGRAQPALARFRIGVSGSAWYD